MASGTVGLKVLRCIAAAFLGLGPSLLMTACGSSSSGGGGNVPPPVTAYALTVASSSPASGVSVVVSPADNSGGANGTTSFTRTYNAGAAVTLTAPATSGANVFSAWTGCTSASTVTCNVTLNASTTVTANYTAPPVAVTPNPTSAFVGSQAQFTAAINGTASSAVTWTLAAPTGSSLSPGTITKGGLYTTPYPAPATVTVTATSTAGATSGMSGSATVTLTAPAAATGPALSVDASTAGQTRPINPYIYGMNFYTGAGNLAAAASISLPIDRWGGNEATSYNYLYDTQGKGSDWYFENYSLNRDRKSVV